MRPLAVEAHGVSIHYGTKLALARSDFTIPAGSVTAIIGPNGSGKSTLLHAIAGLIRPSAGTLVVAAQGKGRISYVLQNTQVNEALPITVRDVVRMGAYAEVGWLGRIRPQQLAAVETALARTGISNLAHQPLGQLSGGQRQRVYVAQGLAQDHDLLLLDEPLTGIDLPTARAIDAIIHEETQRGCTVVLTTHDLSEARAADFVLLLSGRVVAAGPPDEVLTTNALLGAYGTNLLHVDSDGPVLDDPAHGHGH